MTPRATMIAAALVLGAAVPLAAQSGPPSMMRGPDGPHGKMFASMSEGGRKTMMDVMRGADSRTSRAAITAARDHILDVLDNDRLDVEALKRALDDEREVSNAARIRHQGAILAGFQKLSAADRKAFAADARAMRDRMEQKMKQWMSKNGGRSGDMPPPPLM